MENAKLRFIITLLLVAQFGPGSAQKATSTVRFNKEVVLTGTIERFDTMAHKYDTCDTWLGWKTICLIDRKIWFGMDMGMELPRNQLTRLILAIKGKPVLLDVSGMFNPTYGTQLRKEHFKLKKVQIGYLLYAFFSDGAGTYTAQWQIVKNSSIRQKISNDEADFKWQTDK